MQDKGHLSLAKFILAIDKWFDCMNAGMLLSFCNIYLYNFYLIYLMLAFDCCNSSTMKALEVNTTAQLKYNFLS